MKHSIMRKHTLFSPRIFNKKTKWLLDDSSFIFVIPLDLKNKNQKDYVRTFLH
jgi:hypothetical protein